jgi:hypothetical protein
VPCSPIMSAGFTPPNCLALRSALYSYLCIEILRRISMQRYEFYCPDRPMRARNSLLYFYCTFESHLPNTPKSLGMYGGDDGARTRDLCRDSESTTRNLLITGAMDGHS